MQPGGIALCIPTSGRPVSVQWGLSIAAITWPLNTTIHYLMIQGSPVEKVRERLIETALERNPDYILFVDDDVIIHREAIQRLLYNLSQHPEAMVIGGIYVTKANVPVPVVFRKNGGGPSWDWKFGDVFEVEGLGAGCMLIRAEIFKKLEKPWFAWTLEEGEHQISTGEDIYFCQKVKAAGFKVLADGGVICPHWDLKTDRFYTLPKDSYPMREEPCAQSATP